MYIVLLTTGMSLYPGQGLGRRLLVYWRTSTKVPNQVWIVISIT